MINEKQAGAVLAILKQLDSGNFVTVDDTAKLVWADALNMAPAIPFEIAIATARRLAATGERFPRPKEFREFVAETTSGLPSAAEARAQIEQALKQNYPGHPPKVDLHPLVYQASKRVGGTYRLRVSQSERETSQWWREFDAAYTDVRRDALDSLDYAALPEPAAHALTEGSRR